MPQSDPDALCTDAWLWPEGGRVRWWTASGTSLLDLTGPCAWGAPSAARELRDRRDRISLRHGLAQPLSGLLYDRLANGGRLRVHLSRLLDPHWHICPYEWFTADWEPLFGSLIVERHAPAQPAPLEPVDPDRPIVVLNLLDAREPVQPVNALEPGTAWIYDGRAAVEHFLNQTDTSGLAALVVVAHGTECAGDLPFCLPDGSTWTLPLDRGLPPLVILLACGNDEGNLVVDARRLLEGGAVTVLAPLGRPCPEAAGQFLAAFFRRWRAGERVDDVLLDLQGMHGTARGAQLLQLVGRGDLRMSRDTLAHELDDEALAVLAGDNNAAALTALVNRLTLRCHQAGAGLEQAETDLRDLLGIPPYDEPAEKRLFGQLQRIGDGLWPMSCAWVKPLEALFAEGYDHGRLHLLDCARRDLEEDGVPMTPPALHYWSKIYYRQGRYALALQDVARGLAQVDPAALCGRGAGLAGHLVGLLVDLDLPAPAERLQRQLEDCLARRSDEESAWERHKLKDRAARIALRLGQAERAMAIYRLKRAESPRFEGTGTRELAWLLYVGAWIGVEAARDYASEVDNLLADDAAVREGMGPGNADPVYLLRAFAAWAWRSGSSEAWERILTYRDLLEERLYTGDAGPPGLVFTFAHLSQRRGASLPAQIPAWEAVEAALESQRYFLELAALHALVGRSESVPSLLQRLQGQRTPDTPLVFPDWLANGALSDWENLVAARYRHEQSVLADASGATPERLVSAGLLPL